VNFLVRIEVSTTLTLALLQRLPPARVEGFVMQASEKAAQQRTQHDKGGRPLRAARPTQTFIIGLSDALWLPQSLLSQHRD
jgi:hypothetical protein